jgi:glucokinase-like ROK family protein
MADAVHRLIKDLSTRQHTNATVLSMGRGADYRQIREYNRLLILNYVRKNGPTPRVDISRSIHLSRTTVSSIIDELLAEGFVREGEVLSASAQGGRRATQVYFHADAGLIIGMDIGRSHLTFLATDLSGVIKAEQSAPFNLLLSPDVCLPEIIARLYDFMHHFHLDWDRVVGIGVDIPSPLDLDTQILLSPPYMPGWDGQDIKGYLHNALHVPIFLDNDANMGALGESRYGRGRDVSDFAYIKLGTGIGGGIIINGQIYRGFGGSAGEFGHVIIDPNGPLCGCGNHGCLESVASARAIVRDTLARAHRADQYIPELQTVQEDDVDIMDIVRLALAGDEICRAAIDQAGFYIGLALAGLINSLNPSLVVIDGSVARSGSLLLEVIERTAKLHCLKTAWLNTHITTGLLEHTASVLGTVAMVIDHAFSPPTLNIASLEYNANNIVKLNDAVQ